MSLTGGGGMECVVQVEEEAWPAQEPVLTWVLVGAASSAEWSFLPVTASTAASPAIWTTTSATDSAPVEKRLSRRQDRGGMG